MENVLITGVAGFCGRHLVNRLFAGESVSIIGFDRLAEAPAALNLDEYVSGDILDEKLLGKIVKQFNPRRIFHLAGISIGPPVDIYQTNVLGTLHLLEAVRTQRPEAQVLIVGSAAEYGYIEESDLPVRETYVCQPRGAHGLSKYASTLMGVDYARSFGIKVVVARPANIIGAGISASLLAGAILGRIRRVLATPEEHTIKVGDVDTLRDFIAVEDVVEAYVQMLQGEHWGEVFNICSGKPAKVSYVIEKLLSFSPRSLTYEIDPSLVQRRQTRVFYASNDKAKKAFGFKTSISLEESIRAAWDYEMGELRERGSHNVGPDSLAPESGGESGGPGKSLAGGTK